ncbi:hypothetical protein CapIbe_021626 [Capra ibex]
MKGVLWIKGSSQPRNQICISSLAGRFFTTEPPGKPDVCKERASLSRGKASSHFFIQLKKIKGRKTHRDHNFSKQRHKCYYPL